MFSSYMNKRKAELGLTNQDISNLSGIAKGTVDRIMANDAASPNLETAVALIRAVGGSLDEAMGISKNTPSLPPESSDNCTENLTLVRDILNQWWASVSTINREKNSAYYGSIRARDRWLTFSVAVNCVFIAWLIYDLLHPTRGWIQYDQASAQIRQGMAGAVSVCSLWLSKT